jgi:hypothetical protein
MHDGKHRTLKSMQGDQIKSDVELVVHKEKLRKAMTHKYRGSQQSSREVKPKFIDSIQGEPKNIYKP